MAARKIIITIPKTCSENWASMKPEENGRFCSSCQKTVIDFSTLTDRELMNVLLRAGRDTSCGRFREDQLNRQVQEVQPHNLAYKILQKIAACFLLLQSFTNTARSQITTGPPYQWLHQTTRPTEECYGIAGFVKDYLTGAGLTGIRVEIDGTNISTITDTDGYYFVQLAQLIPRTSVTLKAAYINDSRSLKIDSIFVEAVVDISALAKDRPVIIYRYPYEKTNEISATMYKPLIEHFGGIRVTEVPPTIKPINISWPFHRKKKRHE